MNLGINLGCWGSVFAVPSDVVDKYIKIASGGSVKVLLFLLRHSVRLIASGEIASVLSMKNEDVCDALLFWEQVGLLIKNENVFQPAPVASTNIVYTKSEQKETDVVEQPVNVETEIEQVKFTAMKTAALRSPHFSPIEIADTVKGDDKISFLFRTCESLYGRPLKHTEQNALVTITEHIGLPTEVTLMLVDYCVSVGKATPAYMRNLAMEWVENDVTDINSAERFISQLQSRYGAENMIKSIFGINRALSQKEKEYANSWVNDFGFNCEIITLAYDINVNMKGQSSFPYIARILEDWHAKGLTSKDQILEYRNKNKPAHTENISSLDTNEIDNIILDNYT